MKNTNTSNDRREIQAASHKVRPQTRDDMDGRANEEQDWKGTDTTHNRKDTHSKGKKSAAVKNK